MSSLFTTAVSILCFVYCSISTVRAVSQGSLRFFNNSVADTSQAWSAGIVQIYYGGSWGNICDDSSFGQDEADVLCHQFGYNGASSYSNTGSTTKYGTDNATTALKSVSCSTSTYRAITQCTFSASDFSSQCEGDENDVIVTCDTTRIWDSPTAGDIRLTGGKYSNQGLLEVYCNDEWGTVCENTFGSTEALVACRQLGYNDYGDYEHLPIEGKTSQKIWLDSLSGCSSLDDCLTSCQNCPSQDADESDCDHSDDVTLECEYDDSRLRVYTNTDDTCDMDYAALVALAIAVIVVVFICCCICCILIITVPICICCCLGIGLGAAAKSSSGPRSTTVTEKSSYAI